MKFERIGKTSIAQQYWRHTFQILIPPVIQASRLHCPTVAQSSHIQEMCQEMSNVYGHIDRLTENIHQRLSVFDSSMKMLIPDGNNTVKKQWSKDKQTAL